MLMLYLYQSFIFLLSHLHFFLHFFFTFMVNLFKKHPIIGDYVVTSTLFNIGCLGLNLASKEASKLPGEQASKPAGEQESE